MRFCQRFFFAVALLLPCPLSADSSRADQIDPTRLLRLDTTLQAYVDEGRLPGAVYAVARGAQPPQVGSIGSYQPDNIFRIYSMTKPVTTVAALMLYEEGAFLLGDPVSRYLPEFSDLKIHSTTGAPTLATMTMTIKHLLTHTAGLAYGGSEEALDQLYDQAGLWQANSSAEFVSKVAALPLAFEPGSAWRYSVATDVLGVLVERLSGQRLDDFVEKRIFKPLAMNDTGFSVPPDKANRFLPLYEKQAEGMVLDESLADSSYFSEPVIAFGGSGLVSTARDYMRFAQMLLGGGALDGQRLLAPATVELMLMDHLPAEWGSARLPEPWIAQTENRNGSLELGLGFGLGGYVITDVAQNSVPGSVGTYAWGGGASTYFFIDPRRDLAAVFLIQLRPSNSYPLRAQFRALVYQADVRIQPSASKGTLR